MRQKRIQQEYYDHYGEEWQRKAGKPHYIEDMMRLLPPISGNILEVSAGRFTPRLVEMCESLNVLDISMGSLKSIEETRANRILADSAFLPFADQSFDYSVGFGVLHHVAQVEETLSECIRVTRKGVYFMMERNPLEPYYTLKVLLQRRKEEYGMLKLPVWKYRKMLKRLGVSHKITITDFASVGFPRAMYLIVRDLERKYLQYIPLLMNFASHINLYIDLESAETRVSKE